MSQMSMTPSRPYLIRALSEWIMDNDCTPYLLVDAGLEGVLVPQDFINDGQIVLNISTHAVRNLLVDQEGVSFNARFGGVPMDVHVPIVAILAIYARENGQGMVFGQEAGAPELDPDPTPTDPTPVRSKGDSATPAGDASTPPKSRPSLKVVK